MCDDNEFRRQYYAGIRRVNRSGNRYECPTCKRANALSQHEHNSGYQCKACTRAEEGPLYEQNEYGGGDY